MINGAFAIALSTGTAVIGLEAGRYVPLAPADAAPLLNHAGAATNSSHGPPPCPADELSCGKQKPVRSDGVRPFINREMGLSVIFPRGYLICMGRSGDAPRGFYAWLGIPTSCTESKLPVPPGYFGIYASFNVLDWTSPRQNFRFCKPLSPGLSRRLLHAKLRFAGHPSAICQRMTKDGVELTVTVLGGPKCDGISAVDYNASLGTTWKRFDVDLKRFETFIHQAKIGNPDYSC